MCRISSRLPLSLRPGPLQQTARQKQAVVEQRPVLRSRAGIFVVDVIDHFLREVELARQLYRTGLDRQLLLELCVQFFDGGLVFRRLIVIKRGSQIRFRCLFSRHAWLNNISEYASPMAIKTTEIDTAIIGCLQRGILQPSAIARKLEKMDATVVRVWRRLKSLQDKGVIIGYYARLDLPKIGYPRGVYAQISLHKPLSVEKLKNFELAMRKSPNLLGLFLVDGIDADYIAHFVAGSEAACASLVRWVEKHPDVRMVIAAKVLRSSPLPSSPPVSRLAP